MALYRGPVGNILFDSMTRTKTAEGVVAALDLDGIKKYTNWLTSYIIAGDSSDASTDADMAEDDEEETESNVKEVENRRAWAIDQLVLLIRKHTKALPLDTPASVTSIPEQQWIAKILQFLIVHGFTKVLKTTKKSDLEALRNKPEEPFSDNLQQVFRARFFSSLSHLINVNTKCRSEPWTKYSLDTLLALHKDTKHVTSLIEEETMEEISVSVKLLSQTSGIVSCACRLGSKNIDY
jgi:DNA polymerase phi